jgi:hypothetical protein
MATRRRCPPDSSDGIRPMHSSRPTNRRTSSTRRRTSGAGSVRSSSSLKPTFSATVSESKRAFSWNSIPMSSRTDTSCASVIRSVRWPSMVMDPASGFRSPRINLRTTVPFGKQDHDKGHRGHDQQTREKTR